MNEKSTHSKPQRFPSKQLRWTALGSLLAALAFRLSLSASSLSFVPWSSQYRSAHYALCSDSESIYTVDANKPRVQCVVVRGSHIERTGTFEELRDMKLGLGYLSSAMNMFLGWPKVYYTPPGSIVVPGLADSHAHILEYGFKMNLQLDGADSVDEVIRRVKAYINAHPDVLNDSTRWIEGMGWDQTRWPGKQFPTAADFDHDLLLRDRPIALSRVDGHASWVSSHVLKLMGEIPDKVEGGAVIRDHSGKPTGVFVDNAMSLIPNPSWSEEQMMEYFELAMNDSVKHGLTSIHDAGSSPDGIRFLKKLSQRGKIPIRLYLMGLVDSNEYWGGQIERLIDYGRDQRLNVRSIKLVTDGALGSWGAALLEPYSDNSKTSGIMRIAPDPLRKLVRQFWKDGWQVNIHCIGDEANKVVLDIYEDIIEREGGNATTWRPRIEHAQIMRVEDLERVGRLGVLASVQPTHATSDMGYAESRLGPERIKGAYAYQKLLQVSPTGTLPLGSDFPVEGINPLLGFYAAVSRLDADGDSPHGRSGWFPEQRLSRGQALKGMTLDAAYASFAEAQHGSLEPGKKADYVILDRDIMDENVDFDQILKTKVLATVVDGRIVYGEI